ncbi:MAG: hypothetical protein ABSG13_01590 [Bryobacteraceae bacterium]
MIGSRKKVHQGIQLDGAWTIQVEMLGFATAKKDVVLAAWPSDPLTILSED